jgi:hypothetical protein
MIDVCNPAWCRYNHAEDNELELVRINFTRPDGTTGSISVSPGHNIYTLPSSTALDMASNVSDMGAGIMRPAKSVTVGSIVPVSSAVSIIDEVKYTVATVTAVEAYEGDSWYNPVVESPYIVANGLVVPLWISFNVLLADRTIHGQTVDAGILRNTYSHIATMPLWMQHLQPVGTPGKDGQWNRAHVWPPIKQLASAARWNMKNGRKVDYPALHAWAASKYDAWKGGDASSIPSVPDVVALINGTWVENSAGPHLVDGSKSPDRAIDPRSSGADDFLWGKHRLASHQFYQLQSMPDSDTLFREPEAMGLGPLVCSNI